MGHVLGGIALGVLIGHPHPLLDPDTVSLNGMLPVMLTASPT